jgi:hypothetical protein
VAKKDYAYWLPEEEYQKLIGQTRNQLHGVFYPLRIYGQGVYCDGAEDEVMQLFEEFGKKIRGRDVPLVIKKIRNPRD